MTGLRYICAVALIGLTCAVPAAAQQTTQPTAVFAAAGIIRQQVVHGFGGRREPSVIGPTLGFQLRTERRGRVGFVFEGMAQLAPAKDRRKLYEEAFAPFYLMGGFEIGRRRYIRLSGGVTTVDRAALMAGAALGVESNGRGIVTGAEVVIRVGGQPNALGVIAGIQVRVGGFIRQ
jgi:hypothetical protein